MTWTPHNAWPTKIIGTDLKSDGGNEPPAHRDGATASSAIGDALKTPS